MDSCYTEKKAHHSEETKKKLMTRLARIEGQIRGIRRMIDDDVYCDAILNQITAIKSALDGVSVLLLEKHMKSCVAEQIINGDEEVIDEVMSTIKKMIK